jgi:hypothetical protein
LLLAQLNNVLDDEVVETTDLSEVRVGQTCQLLILALSQLEVKNELHHEVAELVIDELLDWNLSSGNYLHSLFGVGQQNALLNHLTTMLIPCDLLEVLHHGREDHFVTGFRADQAKTLLYHVVAPNVAHKLEHTTFLETLNDELWSPFGGLASLDAFVK